MHVSSSQPEGGGRVSSPAADFALGRGALGDPSSDGDMRSIYLIGLWAVLSASIFGCRSAGESVSPNVLLVSIDSLRADRLGVYGNSRSVSPNLDRLAGEGARFSNALSPTSWTLPAHATILTGLRQRQHRVINVRDRLADEIVTLPEIFSRAGYETFGLYSGPFLHPVFGFGQGFDRYESCMSDTSVDPKRPQAWSASHQDQTNPAVQAKFRRWLGERGERPFFAFIHMWDVHYDYIPPEPYRSMFDEGYDGDLNGRNIIGAGFPLDASERDVGYLLSLYDAEIRYTDDTIGSLVGALESAGMLDDTIIVVTSDHGEEFKDHGRKGHQHSLYDELIRVPLIIWAAPDVEAGTVVEEPVSLADIAPTILDMVGIARPQDVDGESLLPALRGRGGATRAIVSELYDPRARRLRVASMRVGADKLIYSPMADTWVYYDLEKDPREQHSRSRAPAGLKASLSEEVRSSQLELTRSAGGRAPGAKIPAGVGEKLRQLGYLGSD